MTDDQWFGGAIALLFAVLSLYLSVYHFRKARLIEDTPTALIRSAPQGYVELFGTSRPDQKKLKAPLTAQPCLWYDYKVEKLVRSGKSRSWKTIDSGSSDFSFYLDDETGVAHVHPEGAYISPSTKQVWYGSSSVPNTAPGIAKSFFSFHRYRYTEARIHEGQPIFALGWYHTQSAPSVHEQARDRTVELLSAWKLDQPRLLQRFDMNKDGTLDQDEWELARAEAAKQSHAYVLKHYDNQPINVLSKPEQRSQLFIISTKSPDKLVRSLKLRGWVSLLVFIVSFVGLGVLIAS